METVWYFLQKSQTVLKNLIRVNSCPGILKDIKDVVWGGSRYPIKGSMKVCGGGHGVCGGEGVFPQEYFQTVQSNKS